MEEARGCGGGWNGGREMMKLGRERVEWGREAAGGGGSGGDGMHYFLSCSWAAYPLSLLKTCTSQITGTDLRRPTEELETYGEDLNSLSLPKPPDTPPPTGHSMPGFGAA